MDEPIRQPLLLAELVAPYKANDTVSQLVVLAGDLHAMQLLSIWPFVAVTWAQADGRVPEDANTRWQWLWSGCGYSVDLIAKMVDLPIPTVERKLDKLRAARLVFPDGTTDERADAFVRNHIKREMK